MLRTPGVGSGIGATASYARRQWRDRSTVMPELEGVLDLVFKGIRRGAA